MGHIYQITNTLNGKRYIGFTSKSNHLDRWEEHVKFSRCSSQACHRMTIIKAIRKYGENNFFVESLIQDNDDLWLLKFAEPFLIMVLHPEYNSTDGGEGVLGYRHTEETKRKCGMTMKGKKHSKNTIEKMRMSAKGKKPPELAHQRAKEVFGHPLEIDGILFPSRNEAAKHITKKYGISRNTALRRIAKGSNNFSLIKAKPNK